VVQGVGPEFKSWGGKAGEEGVLGEVRLQVLWNDLCILRCALHRYKHLDSQKCLLSSLLSQEQRLPFLLGVSRRAHVRVSRIFCPQCLLSYLQELLDSRLKVLKKELEDYEVFRFTEEKESKELLVSPSCGSTQGCCRQGSVCVWCWSMCLWTAGWISGKAVLK
jgi:hypothetical protein